jgi:hypothetical protein
MVMDNPKDLKSGKPKKSTFHWKLILYTLALIGLVWIGFQAYWEYFKFKIWLAGFGTGAFWVAGLISGFVYFHAAHKVHERIKEMGGRPKQLGATLLFSLGLLVLNPLTVSLAAWIFTPPGSVNSVSLTFFWGCAVGSGIVLFLERLFSKKKPQITQPKP